MDVRAAATGDIAAMQEIERQAGELFRSVGMPSIADDPPFPADELAAFVDDGRAWVIDGPAGEPVAYALVEQLDDSAHIAQVSVHPDHGRQRLGRALVDQVEAWARAKGLGALTLTTFRDVPWNGPYYERLGFTALPADQWGPDLRATVASERHLEASGPRVVLRRAIAP